MGCSMNSSTIEELYNLSKDYHNVISVLNRTLRTSKECNINGLVVKRINDEIYVERRENNKIINTIYFKISDNPYRIIYIQKREKEGNLSLRKRISLVVNNNNNPLIPRNPNLEEITIITNIFNIILSRKINHKTRKKVLTNTRY